MKDLRKEIVKLLLEFKELLKEENIDLNILPEITNGYNKFPLLTYNLITESTKYSLNSTISRETGIFQIIIYSVDASLNNKLSIKLKEFMLSKGVLNKLGRDDNQTDIKRYISHYEIKI